MESHLAAAGKLCRIVKVIRRNRESLIRVPKRSQLFIRMHNETLSLTMP